MIFLVLNIVFGSTFVLAIKWVQSRDREDIVTVGCINYIAAAIVVLPRFATAEQGIVVLPAVLTGGGMGLCYFIAYFFVVYAIRYVGVAASSVVGALSILMPIVCGIFIWHEHPNFLQFSGIGLALVALMLIGGTKTEEGKREKRFWFTPFLLISFFLLAGLCRLSQVAFRYECEPNQRPTFLLVAFVVAAIPSIGLLLFRQQRISWSELTMGTGLGMSNILQSYFLLKSLEYLPGFVVFPAVSAGGLVFITLFATAVFKEKLNVKSYVGIGIASIALVLLNWMPK